ncbi:hypothetical protein BJX99DRAFT_238808 [Aspergillus californicus]
MARETTIRGRARALALGLELASALAKVMILARAKTTRTMGKTKTTRTSASARARMTRTMARAKTTRTLARTRAKVLVSALARVMRARELELVSESVLARARMREKVMTRARRMMTSTTIKTKERGSTMERESSLTSSFLRATASNR